MAGSRGYAEYEAAPLRSRRARRRPWLRTAQLNAVGWAALGAACGVAGGLGVLAARALSLPDWTGLALAGLPLGAVVIADRRRWAAMATGFGWGGSVEEVSLVAEELRTQGMDVEVHLDQPTPWADTPWADTPWADTPWADTVEPGPEMPGTQTASLEYRNRDTDVVRTVLRAHGIDLPPLSW